LLQEISPESIISLRLILAIALLTTVALFNNADFTINLRNHLQILLLAAVAVFHLWIQITGLKYTTAANTGWIIGTAPIFIAVLGFIFLKEKLNLIKITGIAVAFIGLILLVGKGNPMNINLVKNVGDLLVLLSSFTWGVYSIINKKISLNYSPLMTILYLFILMALIIIPFNINQQAIDSINHLSTVGWISILFLGLLCSGVSYVIWAYSLREMESAKVGAYLYLEPFVTVLSAWLFLKEEITLVMLLSGLLIILGVYIVNKE
jgi:drug/metabolite transporter (DMT)-like permease